MSAPVSPGPAAPPVAVPHSSFAMIRQVAAREFLGRVTARAFVVVTGALLVVAVVGILLASVFAGTGQARPQQIGVVGGGPALSGALTSAGEDAGLPLAPEPVGDPAAARDRVMAGDLDAVLVAQPNGGYTVVTESGLDEELRPVLAAGVEQAALDQALTDRGVPPAAVADRLAAATLTSAPIDPPPPDALERTIIAYVLVLLLFFSTFFYGLNVAIGVVEEKASRVVELLLSTIKPIDLLTGKVLGIGAVGFVQLAVVGGAGLVTAVATGLLGIGGTAVAAFGLGLVFYVLGFLFFAVLYAGAGSLVSRQEDVNGVTVPITVLSFVAFFAAQFSITNPGSGLVAVLSWIPPLSATLMPVRYAQGDVSLLAVGASILIMIVATVLAAQLASRIYRRSVLGTGSGQTILQALRS